MTLADFQVGDRVLWHRPEDLPGSAKRYHGFDDHKYANMFLPTELEKEVAQ